MKLFFALILATAFVSFCVKQSHAAAGFPPLQTVEHVDLSRYIGQWYEIARYPNSFQKGCLGSSAHYTLGPDGTIEVLNRCRDAETGKTRQAKGRAWIIDTTSNAKLKVSFFWPFSGDYWIIDLGKEYEYAVIGTPNRKYFWILARQSTMDDTLFKALLQKAALQGFDPSLVSKDAQETNKEL
jgi:apolipoprotein D and lipocalin family protein